ncbi:MAG: GyrI-like domain-containing protein [Caldilinea sp.]
MTSALYDLLNETFDNVHSYFLDRGAWLPASGYRHAAGPCFERYSEMFSPNDPASTLSIYIPIEKPA